jgi:hypothetical protein
MTVCAEENKIRTPLLCREAQRWRENFFNTMWLHINESTTQENKSFTKVM